MEQTQWQKFQMKFTKTAGKIAANKFLLTLRDSFIMVAATSMIAGFAIMLQNVFLDPTSSLIFGKSGLGLGKIIAGSWSAWESSNMYNLLSNIGNLIGLISRGSLDTFSVLLIVIFAHTFSRKYFPKSKEHMTSVIYALGAFFISVPWTFDYTPSGTDEVINVLGYIDTSFFGTKGVFSALVISALSVWIYNKILQKNITIKMPESVPPAVGRSFESLIPGVITMGLFVVLTGISTSLTGETMPQLFLTVLQKPAMELSGTGVFAFISQFSWGLLQWFGIHPTSIWGPIFGLTWNINDTQNMLGEAHHIYSTLMMNFSTVAAGSCALAPVIALLLFSKRVGAKKISKIALFPAIFNISEPITFGLPIILNPLYFIPWVVAQPLAFYIGIFAIKINFIEPITNNVPWTVPPLLSGLLYTGSFKGVIVQALIIIVVVVLYIPFIKIDNKLNKEGLE